MDYTLTAKNFLKNGFNVLPLQLDGSKSPVGKWKPYQTRFASEHELQQWFGAGQCGIGVIAGAISGNLHVIDFDEDAAENFKRFWADSQEQIPGIMDKLVCIKTPRPGYQVWLRQESTPPKAQRLAFSGTAVDDDGNPLLTIETRGEAAYVFAVGTPPATHKTGREYKLIHGSFDSLTMISDADAESLLNICRSYSAGKVSTAGDRGEAYQGEPRPGDIFNKYADIMQLLIDAGWNYIYTDAGDVSYLARPGKKGAGCSASLGHHRDEEGRQLLHVFSSNAAPFEPGQTYDAFQVFAIVTHKGDFGTAAAVARIKHEVQLAAAQNEYRQRITKSLPAVVFPGKEPEPFKSFPVDLLPDIVQPYVMEHAGAIGVDPAYVAVPMLSVLAGLIGSSRAIYLKRTWTEPSVLWTVTVGDVSSGKTPGWMAATAPAVAIETAIHRAMAQRASDYKQQLKAYEKAMNDGATDLKKPIKEKSLEQLMINDATMETLIDIHSNNSKLILSCDELAAWLRGMDQYRAGKGRDVENWLSIYNGGSMQVNRKTDNYRVYLPQTSISVCGTIQPGVAADTLYTDRFVENGFAARILSVQPPSNIVRWTDNEVSDEIDTAMNHLAQQLYVLPKEQCGEVQRTLRLPCSDEAKAAFVKFTNDTADHAEAIDSRLKPAWLKLRPTSARFALVFAIVKQMIRNPNGQATLPVDLESMKAGIKLAWWFGHELERNALDDAQQGLDEHLAWILAKHPSGITTRQLQQGRRSLKTATEARDLMMTLAEADCGVLTGKQFIPHPIDHFS